MFCVALVMAVKCMSDQNQTEWLLLIHQIPPKPNYFRVKIWRRLQKIGAVAIKQSVYVLPSNGQAYEDLHWIVKEITEGGGTASLSKTVFLEGLSNTQIESLFQVARDDEYEQIVNDTRSFIKELTKASESSGSLALKKKRELSRIQGRFAEIATIDFFNAPGREVAEKILTECDALLRETKENSPPGVQELKKMCGRTWVTRKGIYVDRIACAWLIHRFIDPEGRLKFVADVRYRPRPDELRFDMFEGEFTHIGDNCTFEVLVDTFGLATRPITAIAEIVHDIDLKDKKYNRPEVNGIQAVFSGMAATCSDDQDRLERGSRLLDELYASFGGAIKNK
jgi:hypothetical protein